MSDATSIVAPTERDMWRGSSISSNITDGSENSDAGDNVSNKSGMSGSGRHDGNGPIGSRPDGDAITRHSLWSQEADAAERRPWNSASEFNIWGSSTSRIDATGGQWSDDKSGSLSSMLQGIAQSFSPDDLKNTAMPLPATGKDISWSTGISNRNGNSDSLGLAEVGRVDSGWGGLGLGLGSGIEAGSAFNSFPSSAGGDGWGPAPVKQPTLGARSAAADWSLPSDKRTANREPAAGWPGNSATSTEKITQPPTAVWPGAEPGGTVVHARSSSAVSESSVKDSTGATVPTSGEGTSSTPVAAAPPPPEPTEEELLIAKMVNSNEGWGTRPIRQDTPWVIEVSVAPPLPVPAATTANQEVHTGVTNASGQVWNAPAPREAPGNSNQYWGGSNPTPAPSVASGAEWQSDGDIGVWSGPPPPDPNMWSSAQKELQAQSGWQGRGPGVNPNPSGRPSVAELMLASGQGPPSGWPGDSSNAYSSLPAGIIDKLAYGSKDNAMHMGQKLDAGFLSTDSAGVSGWSNPPPLSLNPQQQSRFGNSGSRQFDMPPPALKIDTWNDPPALTDTLSTGHWGQPPVTNAGAGMNMVDAQFQQLLKLGVKREDAIQMLVNTNPELLNPSRPGTSLGDMTQQQRGRMVRGGGADMDMSRLPQSQQQPYGQKPNAPMMMHQKQHSGGGWPPGGPPQMSGFPGSINVPPPPVSAQMSPVTSALVVQLQSILQPKLQLRSQVQQNRLMTAQQKRVQLDQLNAEITSIKQQIDQLQAPGSPATSSPAIADLLRGLTGLHLGGGGPANNEAMFAQHLLNQFKLDQDPSAQFRGHDFSGIGAKGADFGSLMAPPPQMRPGAKGGMDLPFGGDSWSSGGGGRLPWSQDGMQGMARPSMPPPGLGGSEADGLGLYGRSAAGGSWGADKPRAIVGGSGPSSPAWVLLSNFAHPVDGQSLQSICLQFGLLQTFYFNKTAVHALACFTNIEDASVACAQLGRMPFGAGNTTLCHADVISQDVAIQLFNSHPANWSQIPTSAGLTGVAPPNKQRSGGNIWGDGM